MVPPDSIGGPLFEVRLMMLLGDATGTQAGLASDPSPYR